jgi:hypothetical protein
MYRVKVRYDSKEEEMFESEYFLSAQLLLNKSLTYMRTHAEAISVALYDGRRLLYKESKPKNKKRYDKINA